MVTMRCGSTYFIPLEVLREWPEVMALPIKLVHGVELSEHERLWVSELAVASGWRVDDVIEELRNLGVDPSERVERYEALFKELYEEAIKHRGLGDTKQASEKVLVAVTALIKPYAALKGVFISQWSLSRIYRFVENNVEPECRDDFMELLDKVFILHTHFYEGHLSREGFEERWGEVIKLINAVRGNASSTQ